MAHTTLEEKRKKTIFITGGCRSGKSRFALELANRHYQQKTFIATCQAGDPEMVERIRQHKEQRGPDWRTLEIPIALDLGDSHCPSRRLGFSGQQGGGCSGRLSHSLGE